MKPGQPAVSAQKTATVVMRAGSLAMIALVVLLTPFPLDAAIHSNGDFRAAVATVGEARMPWIDRTSADAWLVVADADGATVKSDAPHGVQTAKPHSEDKPPEGLGFVDRVQDWLARANREFQTTVIPRLSTPVPGSFAIDKDSIAKKLEEVKEQDAKAAGSARRAEEAMKAEKEKKAEEARRAAQEAKRVEEARRVDEARKSEEAKQAEALRKAAEETKQAEEAHKATEEAKRVEAARKAVEEAQRAEEKRKTAEEAKRAEEARQTEETQRAEEARKAAEDVKRAEEKRKIAEEAKRAEEARKQAEDARQAEEARKAAEEAKLAAEARQAAEAKQKQERLEAEAARIDAQYQAAEAQRKADEAKRLEEEHARIAAEKVEAERQRTATVEAEKNKQQLGAAAAPPTVTEPDSGESQKLPSTTSEPAPDADLKEAPPVRSAKVKIASRRLARGPVVRRWIRRTPRCRFAGRRIVPPGRYTVLSGDTLWRISRRHYRAGRLYWRLYRANRSIIRNPNLIYPCQRIFVPRRR